MSDLDDLMDLDPLEMTTDDIDKLIAYHRKNRAMLESGVRGAKPKKDTGPKKSISLAGLIAGLKKTEPTEPKPTETFKRRA